MNNCFSVCFSKSAWNVTWTKKKKVLWICILSRSATHTPAPSPPPHSHPRSQRSWAPLKTVLRRQKKGFWVPFCKSLQARFANHCSDLGPSAPWLSQASERAAGWMGTNPWAVGRERTAPKSSWGIWAAPRPGHAHLGVLMPGVPSSVPPALGLLLSSPAVPRSVTHSPVASPLPGWVHLGNKWVTLSPSPHL